MDSLRAIGCCHIYSARDYTLEGEGEGGDDGSGGPKLKFKGGAMPLDVPNSPTILARWETVKR